MASFGRRAMVGGRLASRILVRALIRLWGRDVMLYVGGVSFFALLAVFPALALLMSFYGMVFTPEQARLQAEGMTQLLPTGAQGLFRREIVELSGGSFRVLSAQGLLALIIGTYATHRGFKALLAGLNFIHDEDDPHGFVKFNLLAFFVALATFAFATLISGVILVARLMGVRDFQVEGMGILDSEWLWVGIGLVAGFTSLYRYAMSHRSRVVWRASVAGGIATTLLALFASWASAYYVDQLSALGAAYGSISAVVIFLIWLSWSVNAVFFGGALATEVEIALHEYKGMERKPTRQTRSLKTGAPHRAFRRGS